MRIKGRKKKVKGKRHRRKDPTFSREKQGRRARADLKSAIIQASGSSAQEVADLDSPLSVMAERACRLGQRITA